MCATNAKRFVNNGDGRYDRCHQRDDVATQEVGKSPDGFFAPGWTEIDGGIAFKQRSRKRPTTRVAALRTLRLRE